MRSGERTEKEKQEFHEQLLRAKEVLKTALRGFNEQKQRDLIAAALADLTLEQQL